MRKFFMTDIHGDYKGMMLLLKHTSLDLNKDQLVLGGDMINRGKRSAEVLKEIKSLVDGHPGKVFALRGNHEEMMGDYYQRGDQTFLDHGGIETRADINRTFQDEMERKTYIDWACSLPLYYEDDEYIYTHAGLNPIDPMDKQSRDILWMSEFDFYSMEPHTLLTLTGGKPVIHGHTPVERIYFDGVRMNCDMGSNTYTIREERGLGLVCLSEMSYWVYKPSQKKIHNWKIAQV
ncbi:metallophosphoesterase family protein [Paenibacillus sp. FSL L8-0709]|uniref:metallophosphoesterase family protein n=1 Tax=Paenibacillus sp. FSL L8-0709 TaxID=2975312 RepID=UPI0030FBFB02